MNTKSFASGIALAVVAAALFALWPKAEWRRLIAFPDLDLVGLAYRGLDDSVEFSGALTGNDIAFKNNLVKVRCSKSTMSCQSVMLSQIGENQIEEPEMGSLKVTQWSPAFIQAVSDEMCGRSIFSIERLSKHITYINEPASEENSLCNKRIMKREVYEIGRPAYWRSLDPHGHGPLSGSN